MMLQTLTPMLRTWDLAGSLAFYTEVLGFSCRARHDAVGWASVVKDTLCIMFAAPNAHEGDTRPVFTGSLYFQTSDVDALWQQLQGQAKVCYPLESFPYGMREFAIYDNNGYLLQFGQEILSD